jgi:hypothetical protein
MDVSSEVPDKNTVWLFKERLCKGGVKTLFKQLESALFEIGLNAHSKPVKQMPVISIDKTSGQIIGLAGTPRPTSLCCIQR